MQIRIAEFVLLVLLVLEFLMHRFLALKEHIQKGDRPSVFLVLLGTDARYEIHPLLFVLWEHTRWRSQHLAYLALLVQAVQRLLHLHSFALLDFTVFREKPIVLDVLLVMYE